MTRTPTTKDLSDAGVTRIVMPRTKGEGMNTENPPTYKLPLCDNSSWQTKPYNPTKQRSRGSRSRRNKAKIAKASRRRNRR